VVSDRVGVLIIRGWLEEGSAEPLRAQLRATTDVAGGVESTVTLTRPEAVIAFVDEWLAALKTEG
jgi:hypothetical protein